MPDTQQQSLRIAVAVNRFGLGARPHDLMGQPEAWLTAQFCDYRSSVPAFAAAQASADIVSQYREDRLDQQAGDAAGRMQARMDLRRRGQALYRDEVGMRATSAISSDVPFAERLVHFWSNHFAISVERPQVRVLAGAFEREAIRPHVMGRFEDMLLAVVRHPAMQFFLDQPGSIGPNSPAALTAEQRRPGRKAGINENLAREIMELHTLGVRSGYDQTDVTEFALALSGWSIATGAQDDHVGGFVFHPRRHEPGPRRIMGRIYAAEGEEQAAAILHDLAAHEATARHIATKLARHFIADDPPASAIESLADAFRRSGGMLPAVYATLVGLPDAWAPTPAKFKTPWEWTVSSLRGLGVGPEMADLNVAQVLNQLGQPVWRPGSPAGYDDIAASWAAPDALVRRVETAQRLARRAPAGLDARALGPMLMLGLGPITQRELARAESGVTATALMLVSPDFLRR